MVTRCGPGGCIRPCCHRCGAGPELCSATSPSGSTANRETERMTPGGRVAHALVLNATYEPLCVVSARRAVVLVITDKAVSVEPGDVEFHSERTTVRVPAVV